MRRVRTWTWTWTWTCRNGMGLSHSIQTGAQFTVSLYSFLFFRNSRQFDLRSCFGEGYYIFSWEEFFLLMWV